MLDQLEGPGRARSNDPDTAKSAAAIVLRRGTQRFRALEAYNKAARDGLTAHELEDATKIHYASLTPRIGELKDSMRWRFGPLIIATSRTRPSRYGVAQEVCVITFAGMKALIEAEK